MNVAVPLISAAIAGLVAWIVARHQGRTARENWVYDKRYVLYERVLVTSLALDSPTHEGTRAKLADKTITDALANSLIAILLLAPKGIAEQSREVYDLLWAAERDLDDEAAIGAVGRAMGELTHMLHVDLVPKHLR